MATITLPASWDLSKATAFYRNASSMSVSPYNFTQQVYSHPGRLKVVEVTVPPLTSTDGDDFTQFFDSLNGFENTFNMDLSTLYPHEAGITSVAMRLVDPDSRWSVDEMTHFGFTFKAMEAK